MAKTNDLNMFHGDPETALDAVAAASRLLLDMAEAEQASRATLADSDPDNKAAALNMLGAMLFDAHAVLFDAGAYNLGAAAAE